MIDSDAPRPPDPEEASAPTGAPTDEASAPSGDEAAHGVDLWLAPYFRDVSLWPVLSVAVAIFVLLGAWALLLAWVDRNLLAGAALLLLFWMSVDAVVRSRRRGGSRLLLGCVAGFWTLSLALAVGVRLTGWY